MHKTFMQYSIRSKPGLGLSKYQLRIQNKLSSYFGSKHIYLL